VATGASWAIGFATGAAAAAGALGFTAVGATLACGGAGGRSRSHSRASLPPSFASFSTLASRLRLGLFFGSALNLFAHLFRNVRGDRTRVRLLFRDAVPRQKVNDGFRLDLEFAGQLVNSDLIYVGHALRSELRLRLFRLRLLAFTAGGRGLF